MLHQQRRIMGPGDDRAQDPQPGLARDIADHRRELQIHLDERLLHPLDVHRGALHERVTMAQVRAQRDDRRRRAKAPAHKPNAVQITEPLRIGDVGLAPWQIADMPRVDQLHRDAPRLKDLVDRNPEDSRRFERDGRDATRHQPVGEPMEIRRERAKRLHGMVVAIGRHGDDVHRAAAVNPRCVRIDPLQHRRRRTTRDTRTTCATFGHRTPPTWRHPGTGSTRKRTDSQAGSPRRWRHQ
jgi:hypothetical protein